MNLPRDEIINEALKAEGWRDLSQRPPRVTPVQPVAQPTEPPQVTWAALPPCPWCPPPVGEPTREVFKARKDGDPIWCAFITCPSCGADKGVVGLEGTPAQEAVDTVARMWRQRREGLACACCGGRGCVPLPADEHVTGVRDCPQCLGRKVEG